MEKEFAKLMHETMGCAISERIRGLKPHKHRGTTFTIPSIIVHQYPNIFKSIMRQVVMQYECDGPIGWSPEFPMPSDIEIDKKEGDVEYYTYCTCYCNTPREYLTPRLHVTCAPEGCDEYFTITEQYYDNYDKTMLIMSTPRYCDNPASVALDLFEEYLGQ